MSHECYLTVRWVDGLCCCVQGVVEAVGSAVSEFKVGDRVAAVNWGNARHDEEGETVGGAFATYITTAARRVSRIPANVTDEQAAAFPVNYFTAYLAYWQAGMTSQPMWGQPPSAVRRAKLDAFFASAVEARSGDY